MRRLLFTFLVVIVLCHTSKAQNLELRGRYVIPTWRGGSLSLSEKIYFTTTSPIYQRSKTQALLQQALFRRQMKKIDSRLKLGTGYAFINTYNSKHLYENRNRFFAQYTFSHHWAMFDVSLRQRIQTTFRDSSRGSYRINPKTALKTSLKVGYAQPGRPWHFTIDGELRNRILDPRGNFADCLTATLAAKRIIDATTDLTFYLTAEREINVSNPTTYLSIGLDIRLSAR